MNFILFTNCNILDVVNERICKGSILVEDGVIREVGDVKDPEGAEIVDLNGAYVSPGLFNCHTHILMSG
ncbi:MAG: N-ethylammeline chlorohydrolase, partial [Firmicutes bacterium]|nr:N-ethylammeline chlorohydrolase [Bacillota bacterium]